MTARTRLWTLVALALAGASACAAACPDEVEPGWHDGWGISLEDRFDGVLGEVSTDCGYVPFPVKAWYRDRVHRCVSAAYRDNTPFKVGFASWGVDSGFEYAAGRDTNGQLYLLTIGIDLSVEPQDRFSVSIERCQALEFSRRTDGSHVRHREFLSGIGCVEAPDLRSKLYLPEENVSPAAASPTPESTGD